MLAFCCVTALLAQTSSTTVNSDMAILEVQRLQAEGFKPIVDALLQGTTAIAVGHTPDSAIFEPHVAR